MNEPSTYPTTSRYPAEPQWAAPMEYAPQHRYRPQNVNETERLASAVGGSVLLLLGLPRGGLTGILASVLGGSLIYRGATGHCSVYEALGINSADAKPTTAVSAQQGVKIVETITVNRSHEELYDRWRDLERLPQIMRHLERVEVLDETRSRWTAKAPFGKSLEWRAEIITDRRPEVIAWRSVEGGEVETAGSVHFQSLGHDRGTAITVNLKYNPPGGKLVAAIASLLGQGLEQELHEDLHRFKSLMEAGEVPTVEGQPRG